MVKADLTAFLFIVYRTDPHEELLQVRSSDGRGEPPVKHHFRPKVVSAVIAAGATWRC